MTQTSHDTWAAFLGLDWADANQDGCLQAAGTAKRECCQLEHTPEAIDAWVTTRRTRFNGPPVAVGLALDQGPLVSAWRTEDLLVLFPVNPLMLARYRDALTPSRAKDDPTAAELQRDLLRTQRAQLHPLTPQSPTRRALAPLSHPGAAWGVTQSGARLASPAHSSTISRTCCTGCRTKPPPSAGTACVAGRP